MTSAERALRVLRRLMRRRGSSVGELTEMIGMDPKTYLMAPRIVTEQIAAILVKTMQPEGIAAILNGTLTADDEAIAVRS